MSREVICGIYKIENKINGKVYIGQSIDVYKRWKQHTCELNKGSHHNVLLQNSWNKYGEDNFIFKLLKTCERVELDYFEECLVKEYDSFNSGFNLNSGGKSFREISDETRKKLSDFQTNKTEEEKTKVKINRRKAQEDSFTPILQIDLEGNIVKIWNTQRECGDTLKISHGSIWRCLTKQRKTCRGFIWIYKHEYDKDKFNLNNYKYSRYKREVVQTELTDATKIINVFNSLKDMEEKLSYDRHHISRICKSKNQAHGYNWYFSKDYLLINDKFDLQDWVDK